MVNLTQSVLTHSLSTINYYSDRNVLIEYISENYKNNNALYASDDYLILKKAGVNTVTDIATWIHLFYANSELKSTMNRKLDNKLYDVLIIPQEYLIDTRYSGVFSESNEYMKTSEIQNRNIYIPKE